MNKKSFCEWVYPAAKECEKESGISAIFTTAQAALESGWGKSAIGNNLFGITIGSKWTGKKKLVLTTEYFSNPNVRFKAGESVVSITKVGSRYKYKVYRWFRDYDNLSDCLKDHDAILKKSCYSDAWAYRDSPEKYAEKLSDSVGAKYATDPNYAKTMKAMIKSVKPYCK